MAEKQVESPFEKLPVESRQAIMCALSDIESLKSLILTCTAFYTAFNNASTLITTKVLHNELGHEILPEAVAVLEASQVPSWNTERMLEFEAKHLHSRTFPTRTFQLSDALSMSRLHAHALYFALDFAICAQEIAGSELVGLSTPSPKELVRIIRAFYRFELYCNLFRVLKPKQNSPVSLQEQKKLFFSHFSPWENEQLACVRDYLFRKITPAFNEAAEHDVEFGFLTVSYADWWNPQEVEPILAQGLGILHRLVAAPTYEKRIEFLRMKPVSYTDQFLHHALGEAYDTYSTYLDDLTPEQKLAEIRTSFAPDTDPGPAKMWEWVNKYDNSSSINRESALGYRIWGYVMWDLTRSGISSLLAIESHDWPEHLTDEDASYVQADDTNYDHERRTEIFEKGGRGWWSPEDESRVIWDRSKCGFIGYLLGGPE